MTRTPKVQVGRQGSKLLLRLPTALHEQIKANAAEQGVSTNTLVATLLAGAVGFSLAEAER